MSTGLRELDHRLDGGLPAGSTVALLSTPTAPSELFCHQFATAHAVGGEPSLTSTVDAQRDVFYVATDPPTHRAAPTLNAITHFEDVSVALNALEERVERDQHGESQPVVVIDRFSDLLTQESTSSSDRADVDWFDAFQTLAEQTATAETIALLHLHIPDERSLSSAESRVLSMAGAIFSYQSPLDTDTPDQLAIPKVRGATPPESRITLEIGDDLAINPDQQV